MTRAVALLRGINVGRGPRLAMASWASTLTAHGCQRVRTVIQSGNAVFDTPIHDRDAIAALVAAGLRERHGLDVGVVVKTSADIEAVLADNPYASFSAAAPTRLLVGFAQQASAWSALGNLAALVTPPNAFALGTQAAWAWCPEGTLQNPAAAVLVGRKGRAVTTRNFATVQAIATALADLQSA